MADKKPKLILCPYCGNTQNEPEDRCDLCGGFFDDLSLRVTQEHMGPWFIRDRHNPFRPGCSYDVLVKEIQRGKVKPTTILRGPTTRQFWSVARNVGGVAHLLGYCHACAAHVDPTSDSCPECGEVFFAPKLRDNLGLAPAGAAVQAKPTLSDSGSFQALPAAGMDQPQPDQPQPDPTDSTPTPSPTPTPAPAPTPTPISPRRASVDQPVGSSILAGLRSSDTFDPAPATEAAAEATASRDALAWMTSDATEAPDTLQTAGDPTAALPPRQTNLWTWLLILVNVGLFLAAIAALLIVLGRPPANPEPGNPDTGGTPPAVGGGNTTLQPGVPAPNPGATVTPPGVPDGPTPPATGTGVDPTVDINTGDTAIPTPAPGGGGAIADPNDDSIFGPGAGDGTADGRARSSWQARFREAADLERRKQYRDALRVLERIKADAPKDQQPDGLDDAIKRIKVKQDKRELEDALYG